MKASAFKLLVLFFIVGLAVIGIKAKATGSFFTDTETSTATISTAESFCEPTSGAFWASTVVNSNQGLRKNGTPVLPERSNPSDALGSPDGVGSPASGFFSLGFGGSIVLQFDDPVVDGTGADLSFHEITNGRSSYPLEKVKVEVSADNATWKQLADEITSRSGVNGVTLVDLSNTPGVPSSVNYIRVTDISDPAIHAGDADGYDLDAVDATSLCVETSLTAPPEGIADHVVISEIQIAGSGTNDDFIELYNPTDAAVNLNGFRLVKRTSTGSTDENIVVFGSTDSIPAHSFLLWCNSGFALLTCDKTSADTLSNSNSIGLRDGPVDIGTIIDAVTLVLPAHSLGEGTSLSAPGVGSSIERKALITSTAASMGVGGVDEFKGNGFDSNNNATDFILRLVSLPQNSSSPIETP